MPPADRQQQPDLPIGLTFERFAGLNTATTRPGVPDEQAYWLDGFMPLAGRNVRTMWGIGESYYPASQGILVVEDVTLGSGGTTGTYTGVSILGGSGTGALGAFTVSGGSVSNYAITSPGTNYKPGDLFSVASASIGDTANVGGIVETTVTIVAFYFYNIGSTSYAVIFLNDGSAWQVNMSTDISTNILPAGTITAPSIQNIGISQYGSQYLIIVANQTNGYWIWDGAILYQAGSIAPGVDLTNAGTGYVSAPKITASGGTGYSTAFVASISDGAISDVAITNSGLGYLPGQTVTLVFSGGTQAGSGGSLTATLSHEAGGSGATLTASMAGDFSGFSVSAVTIDTPGSGYSPEAAINVSGGDPYSGGQAVLSPVLANGSVSGVNIIYAGNYQTRTAPAAVLSDSGYYYVSSVTIVSGGSGYGPNRAVTATGGGSPVSQAIISTNLNAGGTITSINILSGGNYGSNTAPTLTVTDSTTTAAGSVSLMPLGIQGTAVETYQGRVWVFNGNVFNFTAPGSVSNFATSAGGGSQQSSDSFLKVGFTNAVQTNGFLFIIGDSSMNYISGVTTTGTPPTTTYTNNNADPEVGTPYAAAITTFGQDILIANSAGVFVSSGGAFEKISEPLDGIYNTVPSTFFNQNPFNGLQLSVAKATIFGKRVWMVLVPIIDPVTNSQTNKLLLVRDRKVWWASNQDVSLIFIGGQEINSVYQAWGTDGFNFYPLFYEASTGFTKTIQTKMWDEPGGIESAKADSRFWSLWECNSTVNSGFTLTVDGSVIDSSNNQQNTSNTYTVTGPTLTGLFITPPLAVGQQGVVTGFTIKTTAADMALVVAKIGAEKVEYRG